MDFFSQLKISTVNKGVSTGKDWLDSKGQIIESFSPVDGKKLGEATAADRSSYEKIIQKASEAFVEWRKWPSPKRGEIVRQIGEALRQKKEILGRLVSYEMGKSL